MIMFLWNTILPLNELKYYTLPTLNVYKQKTPRMWGLIQIIQLCIYLRTNRILHILYMVVILESIFRGDYTG